MGNACKGLKTAFMTNLKRFHIVKENNQPVVSQVKVELTFPRALNFGICPNGNEKTQKYWQKVNDTVII